MILKFDSILFIIYNNVTLPNIIIIYAHESINRQTNVDHFITAFIMERARWILVVLLQVLHNIIF